MNNNNVSTFFFIAMMMMIFSGSFQGLFPLIVIYFIAKSIISSQQGQDRGRRQERRDYDRGSRRNHESDRRAADRRYREEETERRRREEQLRRERARQQAPARPKQRPRNNPYKQSGVKKFKEYDYEGAVEDFKKALEIDGGDVAVHFNLACCYSLNENKDKAFYHLSKAVGLGFKDIDKIQTHDALAYLRIQDEFETFKNNGYRTSNATTRTSVNSGQSTDLLEQLQKLQELRERGVLTEAEFVVQKEKLLR